MQHYGRTRRLAEALIEGERVVLGSGRSVTLDELAGLAETLPWRTPYVVIMPPHEYVAAKNLETDEQRNTFEALQLASRQHPKAFRAFFRAYKGRNGYIVVGDQRYWYTQIGPARMMNRCPKDHEVENTRAGPEHKAIKKWTGAVYAWTSEYGIECENLPDYCNLVAVQTKPGLAITRYAHMVKRETFDAWASGRTAIDQQIEGTIREMLDGVPAIEGKKEARGSKKAEPSPDEAALNAIWLHQKDMSPAAVATDLRAFSLAPRMEVERVVTLESGSEYLVQLTVPPVA